MMYPVSPTPTKRVWVRSGQTTSQLQRGHFYEVQRVRMPVVNQGLRVELDVPAQDRLVVVDHGFFAAQDDDTLNQLVIHLN